MFNLDGVTWVRPHEAAEIADVAVQTLANRRSLGMFPPFMKRSRFIFYRLEDIQAYARYGCDPKDLGIVGETA